MFYVIKLSCLVIILGFICCFCFTIYESENQKNELLEKEITRQVKEGKNQSFDIQKVVSVRTPSYDEKAKMKTYFKDEMKKSDHLLVIEAYIYKGRKKVDTLVYAKTSDFKKIKEIKRIEGIHIKDQDNELNVIVNVVIQ
ncbi:hypothetical protein AAGG74_19100 [Bacillus mexicanus]|uniref:hypothetical protein n=1 Tax=Bacillus mexicanus TaxID=2834415 RepID=UPI003D251B68